MASKEVVARNPTDANASGTREMSDESNRRLTISKDDESTTTSAEQENKNGCDANEHADTSDVPASATLITTIKIPKIIRNLRSKIQVEGARLRRKSSFPTFRRKSKKAPCAVDEIDSDIEELLSDCDKSLDFSGARLEFLDNAFD